MFKEIEGNREEATSQKTREDYLKMEEKANSVKFSRKF